MGPRLNMSVGPLITPNKRMNGFWENILFVLLKTVVEAISCKQLCLEVILFYQIFVIIYVQGCVSTVKVASCEMVCDMCTISCDTRLSCHSIEFFNHVTSYFP